MLVNVVVHGPNKLWVTEHTYVVGLGVVVVLVVDDFSDTPAPAPPLPEMLPESSAGRC